MVFGGGLGGGRLRQVWEVGSQIEKSVAGSWSPEKLPLTCRKSDREPDLGRRRREYLKITLPYFFFFEKNTCLVNMYKTTIIR